MTKPQAFGKRGGHLSGLGAARAPSPFGKRLRDAMTAQASEELLPPCHADLHWVARRRLMALYRHLSNLYHAPDSLHDEPVCRIVGGPDIRLLIGQHAVVRVDPAAGAYVLAIDGPGGAVTVATTSQDILLDQVIGHLALDRGRHLFLSAQGLVAQLVGNSLHDIERSLILATLRQHRFNRTRTAQVLGVSVRTIRNKLRDYRRDAGDDGAERDILHLRGIPPGA